MEKEIDRAKVGEFFDKERKYFHNTVKEALKNKDYQSAWLSEIWERLYGKLKKKLDDGEFDVDSPPQTMSKPEYTIKALEPKSQELLDYPVGEVVTENMGFVIFKTLRLMQYANARLGYHDLNQHYSAVVDNLLVLYDMGKELHNKDLARKEVEP